MGLITDIGPERKARKKNMNENAEIPCIINALNRYSHAGNVPLNIIKKINATGNVSIALSSVIRAVLSRTVAIFVKISAMPNSKAAHIA